MRLAEPHPTARKLLQSDRTEGIIERVRDGLLGEESIEGHLADNVRHIGDEVSNFIDKLLGEDQNQVGGVTVSNDYGPTASSTGPNDADPVRCCSGTRRARAATRSS